MPHFAEEETLKVFKKKKKASTRRGAGWLAGNQANRPKMFFLL